MVYPFYDKVTDRARRVLEIANDYAIYSRHPLITNLHLLWGMIAEGKNVAYKVLKHTADLKTLRENLISALGQGTYGTDMKVVPYAGETSTAICEAIELGWRTNCIGCHHLLLGLMSVPCSAVRLLSNHDVTKELVEVHVQSIVKTLG